MAPTGVRRSLDPLPRAFHLRDPEVGAFLADRFGTATLKAILAECRATFGDARTPSKSHADRYWQELRRKARKVE